MDTSQFSYLEDIRAGYKSNRSLKWVPTFLRDKNFKIVFFANFIEFSDLYLFIHCSSIIAHMFLGEDQYSWMPLFSLSIAYLAPPLAAYLAGRLGDVLGRKKVLVLSLQFMAWLTLALLILPYLGLPQTLLTAFFMLIRIAQSFSVAGEGAGAWIYAYETTSDFKDTALSIPLISLGEMLSGVFSLGMFLVLSWAFSELGEQKVMTMMFFSLFVSFLILSFFRNNLKETKSFLEEKEKQALKMTLFSEEYKKMSMKNKNFWCLVAIMLTYPLGFTVSYVMVGSLLKDKLGFSIFDVILHNLTVTISELVLVAATAFVIWGLEKGGIVYRKCSVIFITLISFGSCLASYFYFNSPTIDAFYIRILQVMIVWPLNSAFIIANFYKTFPVIGRFTLAATAWGSARIIGVILGIFVMEWMQKCWGGWECLLVLAFFLILHLVGLALSKDGDKIFGRFA